MNAFHAGPGKKFPKPEIRITADRQQVRFSHIGLWRDVYYLNRGTERRDQFNHTGLPWASPKFSANVMNLGPDQYFVLGDNSMISGDARTWGDPINLPGEALDVPSGIVPGRFLLGKAFFVLAGGIPADRVSAGAGAELWKMRFIH